MLERLRIQNVKSWQDTGDMAFGSLTTLTTNNSWIACHYPAETFWPHSK